MYQYIIFEQNILDSFLENEEGSLKSGFLGRKTDCVDLEHD